MNTISIKNTPTLIGRVNVTIVTRTELPKTTKNARAVYDERDNNPVKKAPDQTAQACEEECTEGSRTEPK